MEFREKLQELRKQRGLTQEALAEQLYVSRTAISKWESGRGYPSIDSLKAISAYFSISIDDLLSGDALLTIAEEDGKQKEGRLRNLVLALMDCGMGFLLFLPLFGQRDGGGVRAVSLLALTAAPAYMRAVFFAVVGFNVADGILLLALRNSENVWWRKWGSLISIGLQAAATLLLIAALQPYAAVFSFALLAVQAVLLIKRT